MPIVHASDETLGSAISSYQTLLVVFHGDWAEPSQQGLMQVRQFSAQFPNFPVAVVDVDRSPNSTTSFRIENVPTLVAFRDCLLVYQAAGSLPPEALAELCEAIVALQFDSLPPTEPGEKNAYLQDLWSFGVVGVHVEPPARPMGLPPEMSPGTPNRSNSVAYGYGFATGVETSFQGDREEAPQDWDLGF